MFRKDLKEAREPDAVISERRQEAESTTRAKALQ